MKKNFAFLLLAGLGLSSPALAIGPRSVTTSGIPVTWHTMPIQVDLESDLDVRGKDVTPLVQDALNQWASLTESNSSFNLGSLGTAVDATNVCCFFYDPSACPSGPTTDGLNPLVIDEDGSITAQFFGTANKYTTLGFASIITFDSSTGGAVKGEAVFNASCLSGVEEPGCATAASVPLSFSDDDFESFIVHEMGHFQGLDHSQVNLTEATDHDPSNDNLINTMFPTFIIGNGANFKVPHRDDQVALAQLYPSSTFASSTWKVTGSVFRSNGTTGLQCANVIARNVANPKVDAVCALTGDFSPPNTADGTYTIPGLQPGQTYTVEVQPIGLGFTGASGYTPCRGTSGEPAPPQFVSQAPATTYTHAAGETQSGVDFTLSGVVPLTLADEPALVSEGLSPQDQAAIQDDIVALETQFAAVTASSCSTGGGSASATSGSGSSGGCSLIRE